MWNDTRVFSPKQDQISVSKMETEGAVETEEESYFIIRDPRTINLLTEKTHPIDKQPTFYIIPKGINNTEMTMNKVNINNSSGNYNINVIYPEGLIIDDEIYSHSSVSKHFSE